MYQLNRQLDLIASINWRVVRAKAGVRDQILNLVVTCRTRLEHPDVFKNPDLTAQAFVDFSTLAQLVAEVGELPFQQNKWLLTVAMKLLHWFGPEDEIQAMEAT